MPWFGRKSKRFPPNATFTLTQKGRDKVQEFGGDPKSLVLTALETRGSSDMDEIAQASGVSKGQIERLVPGMVRGGYIQFISSDMGSSVEED